MQTNCLTETQFMRYLNDEVNAIEARQIDRHLASCALCSDAMEGAMSVQPSDFQHTTLNLDNNFKTTPVMREKTLQFLTQPSRKLFWGIAASFALIATATTAYYSSSYQDAQTVADISTIPTASDALTTTETTLPVTTTNTAAAPITPIATPNGTTILPAPSAITRDSIKATTTVPTTTVVTTGATKQPDAGTAIVPTSPAAPTPSIAVAEAKKETTLQESKDKYMEKPQEVTTRADPTGSYQGASNSNIGQNYSSLPEPALKNNAKMTAGNADSDYQRAIGLYNKGKYQKAINEFNFVLAKQESGRLYHDALWYTANSYLKLEKQAEAKKLLKRIINEKGVHAQEAELLYKD